MLSMYDTNALSGALKLLLYTKGKFFVSYAHPTIEAS